MSSAISFVNKHKNSPIFNQTIMNTILVPTDFSKLAGYALNFAIGIAQSSGATVRLVHVVDLPIMYDTVLMPALNFEEEAINDRKAKAMEEFGKLVAKHDKTGVKFINDIVFGPVTLKILESIKFFKPDLVVMGSHGTDQLKDKILGSSTEVIVRESIKPVLILKDLYEGPIKHIVFPVSFEPGALHDVALEVQKLQATFKSRVHIVWINTQMDFVPDNVTNKRLNEFASRYSFTNYTTAVYNSVGVEEGILEYARYVHGDLIAIGTHGRRGLAHLLKGSLAEDMANQYPGLIWTCSLKPETTDVSH